MKKTICPLLILSIVLYSTPLKADSYAAGPPAMVMDECEWQGSTDDSPGCAVTPGSVETPETAPVIESQSTDQGTYQADQESLVTPASSEEESAPRTKRIRYIILAVVAVIVAVTAMLIVDSNEGHSKNHKKHKK